MKGESNLSFTKLFEFRNDDDAIFHNVVELVQDKLARNLKLNVNEALLVYCTHIVSEMRSNKSDLEIINNSSKILTRENVLIGVPETLREITFNITLDNFPKRIIKYIEPIPTANYIMVDSKTNEIWSLWNKRKIDVNLKEIYCDNCKKSFGKYNEKYFNDKSIEKMIKEYCSLHVFYGHEIIIRNLPEMFT